MCGEKRYIHLYWQCKHRRFFAEILTFIVVFGKTKRQIVFYLGSKDSKWRNLYVPIFLKKIIVYIKNDQIKMCVTLSKPMHMCILATLKLKLWNFIAALANVRSFWNSQGACKISLSIFLQSFKKIYC